MATTGHMESKKSPAAPRLRNPLNVVVEKVGATRAMVHGDVSVESLKELLMSSLSLLPTTGEPNDDEGLKRSGESDRKLKSENRENGEEEDGEEGSGPASKNIKKDRLALMSGSSTAGSDEIEDNKSTGIDHESKRQEELLEEFSAAKKPHDKTKPRKTPFETEAGTKPKPSGVNSSEEESGEADEEEEDERKSLPSCLSVFGTEEFPFSNNARWLRSHFEKPLVQGLKDVVNKKPQDPVGYLGFWLRKYRSDEEVRQRRSEFNCELDEKRLLITSHAPDREEPVENLETEYNYGDYEEGGGNADSNFKNYYPGDAAEVAIRL